MEGLVIPEMDRCPPGFARRARQRSSLRSPPDPDPTPKTSLKPHASLHSMASSQPSEFEHALGPPMHPLMAVDLSHSFCEDPMETVRAFKAEGIRLQKAFGRFQGEREEPLKLDARTLDDEYGIRDLARLGDEGWLHGQDGWKRIPVYRPDPASAARIEEIRTGILEAIDYAPKSLRVSLSESGTSSALLGKGTGEKKGSMSSTVALAHRLPADLREVRAKTDEVVLRRILALPSWSSRTAWRPYPPEPLYAHSTTTKYGSTDRPAKRRKLSPPAEKSFLSAQPRSKSVGRMSHTFQPELVEEAQTLVTRRIKANAERVHALTYPNPRPLGLSSEGSLGSLGSTISIIGSDSDLFPLLSNQIANAVSIGIPLNEAELERLVLDAREVEDVRRRHDRKGRTALGGRKVGKKPKASTEARDSIVASGQGLGTKDILPARQRKVKEPTPFQLKSAEQTRKLDQMSIRTAIEHPGNIRPDALRGMSPGPRRDAYEKALMVTRRLPKSARPPGTGSPVVQAGETRPGRPKAKRRKQGGKSELDLGHLDVGPSGVPEQAKESILPDEVIDLDETDDELSGEASAFFRRASLSTRSQDQELRGVDSEGLGDLDVGDGRREQNGLADGTLGEDEGDSQDQELQPPAGSFTFSASRCHDRSAVDPETKHADPASINHRSTKSFAAGGASDAKHALTATGATSATTPTPVATQYIAPRSSGGAAAENHTQQVDLARDSQSRMAASEGLAEGLHRPSITPEHSTVAVGEHKELDLAPSLPKVVGGSGDDDRHAGAKSVEIESPHAEAPKGNVIPTGLPSVGGTGCVISVAATRSKRPAPINAIRGAKEREVEKRRLAAIKAGKLQAGEESAAGPVTNEPAASAANGEAFPSSGMGHASVSYGQRPAAVGTIQATASISDNESSDPASAEAARKAEPMWPDDPEDQVKPSATENDTGGEIDTPSEGHPDIFAIMAQEDLDDAGEQELVADRTETHHEEDDVGIPCAVIDPVIGAEDESLPLDHNVNTVASFAASQGALPLNAPTVSFNVGDFVTSTPKSEQRHMSKPPCDHTPLRSRDRNRRLFPQGSCTSGTGRGSMDDMDRAGRKHVEGEHADMPVTPRKQMSSPGGISKTRAAHWSRSLLFDPEADGAPASTPVVEGFKGSDMNVMLAPQSSFTRPLWLSSEEGRDNAGDHPDRGQTSFAGMDATQTQRSAHSDQPGSSLYQGTQAFRTAGLTDAEEMLNMMEEDAEEP